MSLHTDYMPTDDTPLSLEGNELYSTQYTLKWYEECVRDMKEIAFKESKHDFDLDPKTLAVESFYSMYNPRCSDKVLSEYLFGRLFDHFNIPVDYAKGKGGYAEMEYWGLYMYLEVFLTICLSNGYTKASQVIPTFQVCMSHRAAENSIFPDAWKIIARLANKNAFDYDRTDNIISFTVLRERCPIFRIPNYIGCPWGDPNVKNSDVRIYIILTTFHYKGYTYREREEVKHTTVGDLTNIDSLLFMTYYYLMMQKNLRTENDIDLYVNCKKTCEETFYYDKRFVQGRTKDLFDFCQAVRDREEETIRHWKALPERKGCKVEWEKISL